MWGGGHYLSSPTEGSRAQSDKVNRLTGQWVVLIIIRTMWTATVVSLRDVNVMHGISTLLYCYNASRFILIELRHHGSWFILFKYVEEHLRYLLTNKQLTTANSQTRNVLSQTGLFNSPGATTTQRVSSISLCQLTTHNTLNPRFLLIKPHMESKSTPTMQLYDHFPSPYPSFKHVSHSTV